MKSTLVIMFFNALGAVAMGAIFVGNPADVNALGLCLLNTVCVLWLYLIWRSERSERA